MSGLFDGIDNGEDDLFNFNEKKPNSRETTPEFFSKVNPSSEMNLFSPSSKPKDSLFDFDDETDDKYDDKKSTDKDLLNLDDEQNEELSNSEEPAKEEPLGFLKDEETNNKAETEEFELIDSTEVPSVEEAERQLEIVRQESERKQREEELLREEMKEEREHEELEDEEELEKNKEMEEEHTNEEVTDGGAFSRVFGGDTIKPSEVVDDASDSEEPQTKNQNDAKLIAQLQQEIAELTSKLQASQSENGGLKSEVGELRLQLNEEREKNSKMEEQLKQKDAEIAALKEACNKPTKPSPSHRKPSLSGTGKQTSVSSPRTSARLKQETSEKRSVAETARRFNQPDGKKPSPSLKRSAVPKKDSTDKTPDTSKVPKQDSTTSRKKEPLESSQSATAAPLGSPDKKSTTTSPPKPVRSKLRSGSQASKPDSSPMISTKPQRNTLDAIKMWEQKTGDKKETSPTVVKKSLAPVKSVPNIPPDSNEIVDENGDENVPPAVATDTLTTNSSENKDEEKPLVEEAAEQKSPLRHGGTANAQTRQKKTESMVVSGTKSKRWAPSAVDKCQVCKKTVYPLERLQADEKVYHKTCFRCTHCKKVVGLGTYAANKGEIFCKTHFKMLFKMKGNYDEGFGREQHKRRWNKNNADESETATAD